MSDTREMTERLETIGLLLAKVEANGGTLQINFQQGLWSITLVHRGSDNETIAGFGSDPDFDEALDIVHEEIEEYGT